MCVNGHLSVKHSVPQGSVLGPVLFVLYINDLPARVSSPMYLFADDLKMYREIMARRRQRDIDLLQRDIHALEEWVDEWLLKIHPEKCKTMTISATGRESSEADYRLGTEEEGLHIERVTEEKDLGIVVDNSLSFDNHIEALANKGNMMVGLIRRTFTHLDIKNFSLLFKALVRPVLEYGQSVWKPYKRAQIDQLEAVQRRATKEVSGMGLLEYPERLRAMNLPTLAFRRMRGDMIEVYKIISGRYDEAVSQNILTKSQNTRTRGHMHKLQKPNCRLNIRKNALTSRVVNNWNALPENVVSAPSMYAFENRLDHYWSQPEYNTAYWR